MAVPYISINNSTGSNTQASGSYSAKPTAGAVYGTAASWTTKTVTLDGSPSLAGCPTDGSSVLWLQTAGAGAARQFFTISAIDDTAKTVTVNETIAGATTTDLLWAIGGKRKDFETTNQNTKLLFTDAGPGWTIDLEYGTGTYTITSTIPIYLLGTPSGAITILSSSQNSPLITTATNSTHMFTPATGNSNNVRIENIRFSNTAATRGSWLYTSQYLPWIYITNCALSGFINVMTQYGPTQVMDRCEVFGCNCGAGAIIFAAADAHFYGCYFHDNIGNVIQTSNGYGAKILVSNCIFANNSAVNLALSEAYHGFYTIRNCRFYTTASNAHIAIANQTAGYFVRLILANNIFYGGTYGVTSAFPAQDNYCLINRNNAYFGQSTAQRSGLSAGTGDVTLGADPFQDKANNNYALNDNNPGGRQCRATGYVGSMPGNLTVDYPDIGGQHADPAGGGTTVIVIED